MNNFEKILNKGLETHILSDEEIICLLAEQDMQKVQKLFDTANSIKLKNIGNKVSLRGLIEIGNVCRKNCYYCGIRRENHKTERFELSQNEILADAELAWKFKYGSIVLQGGEIQTEKHIAFIEDTVKKIKFLSCNELGITLSLGEQSIDTYKRWFAAGAHRYLLRIETSNPEIYSLLHPADHLFSERLQALYDLREAGFQLGSGIMFGFDGQSYYDMARDLLFLKKLDVDMVGMGPYSVHKDTPMGKKHSVQNDSEMLILGCKMIAVLRIIMPDINIASTTVLQALAPDGREKGLLAGANVIMPNVSEVRFRKAYQLYDNKPGTDENAGATRSALEQSLLQIGLIPAYSEWGDSKHFEKRK